MPDDLRGAGAPGGLVDELAVGRVGQRDRAGGGLEHAGGGADDRLHDAAARRSGGRGDWASDWPRSPVSGTPIASAKAAADEMRCSGSISRPPRERGVQLGREVRGELVELEDVAVARRGADQQRPQRRGEAEDVARPR